jgi:hypothetical protein
MKLRKHLAAFMRGWLPKEPKVSILPAEKDSRINERPLTTKQIRNGTDSTRFLLPPAVLLAVLCSLFIMNVNRNFPSSLASQAAGILGGLVVGSIISVSFTKWQLKCLTRDREIRSTVAGLLFIVGVMLIFAGISVGVLFSNLPTWIQGGFLRGVFAGGSVFTVARYVLFLRWEKKNKMHILQNRSGFFVVPQSGTNSTVDTLEVFEKA